MLEGFVLALTLAAGAAHRALPMEPMAAKGALRTPSAWSEAMTIKAYQIDVLNMAFSHDAKALLTVGHDRVAGGNLKIWDLDGKNKPRVFEAGGNRCEQFLPSNKSFLAFREKRDGWEIRQW